MKDGLIKVTLCGKERTLKFNMRAIELFSEMKYTGTGAMSASATEVYAGLIGHLYEEQKDADFTFKDVAGWVEDLILSGDTEVLASIDKCFSDSRAFAFVKDKTTKKKK